ncbi:MAG TPA: hypothetical protein VKV95_21845 [Terriglobia bacterium]|nr:hypothetical protein [Terriglobia bacterium]
MGSLETQTRFDQREGGNPARFGDEYFRAFDEFKAAVNKGSIWAAEPDKNSQSR